MWRLFEKGADKVSVNSSVLKDPGLIDRLAAAFGKTMCCRGGGCSSRW